MEPPPKKQKRAKVETWDLCEEITAKRNWYSKVFDETIVGQWRSEVPDEAQDNFAFALTLLRATAQGSRILPNCGWSEEHPMCESCETRLKREIMKDPGAFGFDEKEIGPDFFDDNSWLYDIQDEHPCMHPRCHCDAPHSSLNEYVQYLPTGVVSQELHARCKQVIADLSAHEPIDWHPGSNEQVRDIIHPSLYCYVKGVSVLTNKNAPDAPVDEAVQFQWLPSEFKIDSVGKCKVASYINNLKADKYPDVVPLVEEVFEKFVPHLEDVIKQPVKDRDIQVIVKFGSIILDESKPNYNGGSWHIEGMPYEHIAATCIHYVDATNITDSFLEFRKPVLLSELNIDYPQSDGAYTSHHYGIDPGSHHEGVMNRYLGLIRCHEGASVIFPNSLQHHVKDFSLAPGAKSALRTIIAFFVIDPQHRIVSTADVAPQQNVFTLDQANQYRERLMFHRKFFVERLNKKVFERPYSLCEH